LQQCQGTQDDPNLLNATTEQLGEFLLVLRRDIDGERVIDLPSAATV